MQTIGAAMVPSSYSDSQQGRLFPSTIYYWIFWVCRLFISNGHLTSEAGPSTRLTGVPDLNPAFFTRVAPGTHIPSIESSSTSYLSISTAVWSLSPAPSISSEPVSGWLDWRAWGDTSDWGLCSCSAAGQLGSVLNLCFPARPQASTIAKFYGEGGIFDLPFSICLRPDSLGFWL